jgi:hypothetical protein
MTLMMTGTPTSAFDAPFDPDQQMPAVTSGKTAILLISARTLDVPLTEEAEAEQ